jgi:molybdenum cofactor sulfurtransferase
MQTFFVNYGIREGKAELATEHLTQQQYSTKMSLEAIYVYPVKSCGRFEVAEWEITSHGLLYDREWVLVDDNFNYLNQKKVNSNNTNLTL